MLLFMKTRHTTTTNSSHELKRVGECLYRAQSSNIYYALFKRHGRQVKRSLKTTDFALAKRRLKEILEQAEPLAAANAAKIPFDEVALKWAKMATMTMKPSSETRQFGVIKSLSIYFGAEQTRKISKSMVEEWAIERSQKIAARTYNYERESLIRILDYAQAEGLILENPARSLKRKKISQAKPDIPTKEQFSTMIETIRQLRSDAKHGADLCELLAYSGCRLNEGANIRWGDVDFDKKMFTVTGGKKGTKNHEVRSVPLFPALESLLKRLLNTYNEPPPPTTCIAQISSAKKAMENACKQAGLPHFTHHHLRHFFCSNAIEAGIDFKAIAGWLGHKDGGLLVAKTYGHLRDEHSAEMAKKMTFGITDE
jgi:integrase